MTERSELTSVTALVKAATGIDVEPMHKRFEEPGWSFQGAVDEIDCDECGGTFDVYRKPYKTSKGEQRYWAIVCIGCREISALVDFESGVHQDFRDWSDAVDEGKAGVQTSQPSPVNDVAAGPVDRSDSGNGVKQVDQGMSPQVVPPPGKDMGVPDSQSHKSLLLARKASELELDATKGVAKDQTVGPLEPATGSQGNMFEINGPLIDLSELVPGETFIKSSVDQTKISCVVRACSATKVSVEVEPGTDVPDGSLLIYSVDPSQVPKAFHEYLHGLDDPGFGKIFDGSVSLTESPELIVQGLNAGQRKAAGQIAGGGASAIWGPPGTGKTKVIGAAVSHLLAQGKSVCVVSNTNVAVDQSILKVVEESSSFEAGKVLRIGNPSISEIIEHGLLTVKQAVEVKFAPEVQAIALKTREIDALRLQAERLSLTGSESIGAGLEVAAVEELVSTRERLAEKAKHETRMAELVGTLAALNSDADAAGSLFDEAHRSAEAIRKFEWVIEADRSRKAADLRLKAVADSLDSLATRRETVGGGLLNRREKRRLELEKEELQEKHLALVYELTHLDEKLEVASSAGVTADRLKEAFEVEISAATHWSSVKAQVETCTSELEAMTTSIEQIGDPPKLSERDLQILEMVDRAGSVQSLFEEHQRLEEKIRALKNEIDSSRRKLSNAEEDLVRDAQIVGTTLAQLVLHRGLKARKFDFVIIDEVSAALTHTVLVAASKATQGCTLVGDFEQNWPITRVPKDDVTDQNLRKWMFDNPFALLDISSADEAERAVGCAVLRHQYRFGPKLTELANHLAYGGTLIGVKPPWPEGETEIVFVDTSGFRNEGFVHRGPNGSGRYWGLGAAISVEIAREFDFEGVGVVTPYKLQSQLIKAQMVDHGAPGVQVGTVHSFQGREFPTMIVDLVEDGTGSSWVARSRRDGNEWHQSGARLFTVAVTRTSGHLYIVGNIGAVRGARSGPLGYLNQMIKAGDVAVQKAESLISLDEVVPTSTERSPAFVGDGFFEPNHSQLLDDEEFYDQLLADIGSARNRCVIFSPFVTHRRISSLAPHLENAISRGVKVTCITKDAAHLGPPGILDTLKKSGIRVHERSEMHHKVVILDDSISYLGSLNTLSNNGKTGEVMMRVVGAETTSRIAQWMKKSVKL